MHFNSIPSFLLGAVALSASVTGAATDEKKPDIPCTTHSLNTGSFFDLRSLSVSLTDPSKKLGKGEKTDSWHARGYDYKGNFTLNICAPVVEDIKDVVGVSRSMWKNVSAYYESGGKVYSIGQESSKIQFRGRKLVLQYTDGSPCAGSNGRRGLAAHRVSTADSYRASKSKDDDDEEDDDDDDKKGFTSSHLRKSTIISFHCERDPMAAQPTTSFVGTDPDECAYFFEVRSQAACGGAEPVKQTLGPGGVFGIIAAIAVLVYFIGGVMYQRSVAHARGWRQLPNYSMWAGIGTFFQDMFIIATSSCARCLPGRRGYHSLSISANGNGPRGRSSRSDDENRLIDQLDEEWDD